MEKVNWRSEFAGFLERLAAAKGGVSGVDWNRYAVTHYPDAEIEKMRRKVVRFAIRWTGGDWPELNCELYFEWARRIRNSTVA